MKATRLLTIAVILFAWFGTSRSGEPSSRTSNEVLELKPFRVTAGYFDVSYSWDPATKLLRSVQVTWVSPGVKRLGVRIGHYLDGVDGTPVNKMTVTDFMRTLELPLRVGEERKFIFATPRRPFRKETFVAISIKKIGDKEPIQSAQPTPGS